jgi:DNA-binding LacI/PurR family transcriptional regulator
MAIGAMRTLRERGLGVPTDVSLIGIDDHYLSGVLGLSTVAQPAATEGRLAASMLLESLTGGRRARPLDVVVPTRLVRRETTRPPRPYPIPLPRGAVSGQPASAAESLRTDVRDSPPSVR